MIVLPRVFSIDRLIRQRLAFGFHNLGREAEQGTQERNEANQEQNPDRALGVKQHRNQQSFGATNAIADLAEENAADRPTDQQNRGEESCPVEGACFGFGRTQGDAQQGRDAVGGNVVKQ